MDSADQPLHDATTPRGKPTWRDYGDRYDERDAESEERRSFPAPYRRFFRIPVCAITAWWRCRRSTWRDSKGLSKEQGATPDRAQLAMSTFDDEPFSVLCTHY
ncbi:hypothetical protein TPA0910_44400 [Streptomyces hygroscopicus subsp. sporocinereus]|uniref:Uncharacterized protein n=1 Tax=Streptomyces hygroscopicus TaxID=1912 RepID=A0ABQ3U325_STRHY|nr:hypothetical protein [Streptomyces hygroscopicus]GHJ30007.1 hypothetical protein TPA0910_44400 [Streptomyces hygroscopicus]